MMSLLCKIFGHKLTYYGISSCFRDHNCERCGLIVAGTKRPSAPMPKCKPPKTDFTEMCESCFGSMISKMPLRTICDLKEVERQRMVGCSHRAKPIGPPNTKLNGDPLD